MARHRRRDVDDLRYGLDRDDDELVRDALDRLVDRREQEEPPTLVEPRPLNHGEVVCRTCRLVVRRADLAGTTLLVCNDCYRD